MMLITIIINTDNGHFCDALAITCMQTDCESFWILRMECMDVLCSDARNMARDVLSTLERIIMEKGNMEKSEAEKYIKKLQNKGRYSADVWSWDWIYLSLPHAILVLCLSILGGGGGNGFFFFFFFDFHFSGHASVASVHCEVLWTSGLFRWLLAVFICVGCCSPWYNRTGWLGVKHQVIYLLTVVVCNVCQEPPSPGGFSLWKKQRKFRRKKIEKD